MWHTMTVKLHSWILNPAPRLLDTYTVEKSYTSTNTPALGPIARNRDQPIRFVATRYYFSSHRVGIHSWGLGLICDRSITKWNYLRTTRRKRRHIATEVKKRKSIQGRVVNARRYYITTSASSLNPSHDSDPLYLPVWIYKVGLVHDTGTSREKAWHPPIFTKNLMALAGRENIQIESRQTLKNITS